MIPKVDSIFIMTKKIIGKVQIKLIGVVHPELYLGAFLKVLVQI
jgi:hypothetical protein